MTLQLKIVGILLMLLAVVHIIFPRYFNWKEEFKNVSLINKEMMYVHTFFVALMVFLMGWGCWANAEGLVHTELGQQLCFALGVFWACRLWVQWFGYSTVLWKGKLFETMVHIKGYASKNQMYL